MDAVIVHGPQGCGKTRNKKYLMDHFGLSKVMDNYKPGDELVPDTLHLTNVACAGSINYYDVIKGS